MYKKNKNKVADLGGAAALVGVLTAIVLAQIIVSEFSTANLLQFYFIIIVHATFGLLDDLINISNLIKIVAPYFMAIPIVLLVNQTLLTLGPYTIDLGYWYVYLIAPVYLLVVTNLINMHSGYNGLASGLTWILLLTLGIRSVLFGQTEHLFYLLPVFGALSILIFFDKYPTKMFWGNIGSMMMGACVGAYIIISNAEIFGIIILLPHIFDFFLYLISVFIKKKKFLKIKFGELRKDGTIKAPTKYKLKFLLPYYFRLTEKQTTWILYGITAIFCILGLAVGV